MNNRYDADSVFTLFKTLTGNERKLFRKTLKGYDLKGGKNLFLVLFDVLINMTEYSHKTLVTKTSGQIPGASLSSVKSQFKKRLLAFLRTEKPDKFTAWHADLEIIRILINRGLFKEARDLADNVKEAALAAEQNEYALLAMRLKGLTVQHTQERSLLLTTRQLGAEVIEKVEEVLLAAKIYNFYTTIAALIFQGGFVRDADTLKILKEINQDPINQLQIETLGARFRVLYLNAKFNLARLNGDFSSMHQYSRKRIELLQDNIDYFKAFHPQYIAGSYIDHVDSSIATNDRQGWQWALQLYKDHISVQSPNVQYHQDFYVRQLHSFGVQNDVPLSELARSVKALDDYYKNKTPEMLLLKKLFEMSLFWGYYKLRQYDTSLFYSRKLTQENVGNGVATEIEDFVRFITLAVSFEKSLAESGGKDLATYHSLVESEYHHFRKKRDGDYRLELALIAMIKAAMKVKSNAELIPLLNNLEQKYNYWANQVVYIKCFSKAFDLNAWFSKQCQLVNTSKRIKNAIVLRA